MLWDLFLKILTSIGSSPSQSLTQTMTDTGKAAPNLSILSYWKAGNGFPSCLFKYVPRVFGHKGAIVNDLGN